VRLSAALAWASLAFWVVGCAPPDAELTDAELFVRYCSECHGDDGRGAPHYEPEEGEEVDLAASAKLRRGDRDFARRRMLYGSGPMPAFEHELAPEDFDRLLDFVMELAQGSEQGDPDGP
jgi:mono/diheme cytochrome c family protein